MSDRTKIEWADASWNVITGCTEVTPGCDNCYAKTFAERWRGTPGHYFEHGFDVVLRPDKLDKPLHWKRPRRIFVNSMSDLFHDKVPDEYIAEVFAVMAAANRHTFQLLTKRHGRMRSLLSDPEFRALVQSESSTLANEGVDITAGNPWEHWPLPNVWLGVSVEDQQRADLRIPALLDTPAAVRWLSCEPIIGPVDVTRWVPNSMCDACMADMGAPMCDPCYTSYFEAPRIDWVVVGGESGPRARPMEPAWARGLRDQCITAGVPFFFKQWGEHVVRDQMTDDAFQAWDAKHGSGVYDEAVQWRVGKKAAGRLLDGRTWDEFPGVSVRAS